MEVDPETRSSNRLLARLQERYGKEKDLLIYEDGVNLEAEDCADAWRRINSFMLNASLLHGYRVGNRHIVPNISITIKKWGNLIPFESFGYNANGRLARLVRNYLNVDSLQRCRTYMGSRSPSKPSTHGITFGTGRKKTPPCLVGGTFFYNPGRLHCSFLLRASEITKTLGADFHFFNHVIRQSVPDWMSENLAPVRLNLSMAYCLAQWFPLVDMIMPGYPINPWDHKFHMMCYKAIKKARNLEYESKWKPEKRLLNFYRKELKKYKSDDEGRIVSGPSFFPRPTKHVS